MNAEIIVIKDIRIYQEYEHSDGSIEIYYSEEGGYSSVEINKESRFITILYVDDRLVEGISEVLAQKQLNEICKELKMPFKFAFAKMIGG